MCKLQESILVIHSLSLNGVCTKDVQQQQRPPWRYRDEEEEVVAAEAAAEDVVARAPSSTVEQGAS